MAIRVTLWNEFIHEKNNETCKALYPDGMHAQIAQHLEKQGMQTTLAALEDPEHGLTEEVLENTDVLTWWAHVGHGSVEDEIVNRVYNHVVNRGMGLIVLHSGHFSKIFKKLMGTTGNLKWREVGEMERLWVVNPAHPIAKGIGEYIELPETEMYGEYFDIADPDEQVFISWFEGGEVFRSGNCWRRGKGKVFYFRPGHETYPIYHNEQILKVITNAVEWANYSGSDIVNQCQHISEPLSEIKPKG